jgi:hypothetical protein
MTDKNALYTHQENSMKEDDMADNRKMPNPDEMRCASCGIRQRAEAKPDLFFARVWKWHTGWCPGWNAYQKALSEISGEVIKVTPNT